MEKTVTVSKKKEVPDDILIQLEMSLRDMEEGRVRRVR